MKPGWKFLNSKEIKNLLKKLKEQYGFIQKLDYAFLKNEKRKVYLVSRDVDKIDFEKLRINSMGSYFCEVNPDGVRLSVEGSQIVGPHASKNVVKIDDQRGWMKGFDIDFLGETKGFVIVKSGSDFMGCAKHKNNILLNYVPKERRIRASD
ncbi:hypothetical protein GOV08_01255 [Candidatus Woesearchaeota archaeon]|nr:hypothetical protein [Candidatus Woesearchaeota archaeon]